MKTIMDASITVVTPTLIDRVNNKGLDPVVRGLKKQSVPFEWKVEINTIGNTDFCQSMNKMIATACGDWIVSVQDFIEISDDALAYISTLPKGLYTFPVGKLRNGNIDWDWRKYRDENIHWQEWEICFGAIPREWVIELGGFDEQLDTAWGFDNVNLAYRAYLKNMPIFCDNKIHAIALDHDSFMEHPLKEKRNPSLHNKRLDDFSRGETVQDIKKYMV